MSSHTTNISIRMDNDLKVQADALKNDSGHVHCHFLLVVQMPQVIIHYLTHA